jgi:polar amino acid transport system substrate-binding protein
VRKILAIFAVLSVATFAACSSSGSSKSAATTKSCASTTTKIDPVTSGTLTVATALPAPGFWNGDDPGSITGGFEDGMAEDIAKAAGLSKTKIVNVSFDALVAGQSTGYDLALSQVTITKDRAKVVSFSVPYFSSDQGILAKTGTKVTSLADAKKLKWGVQGATTGQTYLDETIKPDQEANVYQDTPSMFTALQAGQVEAVLLDTAIVLGQAAESNGQLAVVGQFKTGEEYGAILPKGSANKCAVDNIIKTMRSDGTLKQLNEKWLVPVFKGDLAKVPFINS